MKDFKCRKSLYLIPWIALLGGWLLGELSGENSEIFGAWLLLFSSIFFGLPHGAYDFWILFDSTRSNAKPWQSLIILLTTYLLTALLVIGVWYFIPSLVLVGFLALTAWHFGSGDAIWEDDKQSAWILESAGRGLLIISAPLTFYPIESGFVLEKLNAYSSEKLILFAPYFLVLGLLLFILKSLMQYLTGRKEFRNYLFSWLEIIFLLMFFRFVTPLLAVTIYLIGVHSWRHLLRLEIYERNETSFQPKSLTENIRRFHQRSLPITLISLGGLGLIFWLWQLQITELANYTSAYLVLLSALTLPHAILITTSELNRQAKLI